MSVWLVAAGFAQVAFAAPQVRRTSPDADAAGANIAGAIQIMFSEAMNPSTINATTVSLRNSNNVLIAASVLYSTNTLTAHLIPGQLLSTNAQYTATVKGGGSGVKNAGGQALDSDHVWSFTTVSAEPYGNGPGGPLLVLTSPTNGFNRYVAEILLAEGLNAFALRGVTNLTSSLLTNYDVVLLGEAGLSGSQVNTLSNWVVAGGKLIAMRPDKKLAGLLGLTDAAATLSEGYLRVDTNSSAGAGIVGETIQFHGAADRYTLAGATAVATLYSTASNPTVHPAVTLRTVGTNGGAAAAFTYDLARSIVFTRQGNPAWQGQNRDGLSPLRSDDLFYGNASFDPQPDYVDLNKLAIPQADEQQRLLANLILRLNMDRRPLPRFWYFPDGHRAVVVMTGDDHANDGTTPRFQQYAALSPPGGSYERWETVRGSSYMYPNTPMSDAEAAAFHRQGFEVALHANTGCADYTVAGYDSILSSQLASFRSEFPSLPYPTTHRIHCIAWSGYTIAAEVQFKYGMRLDVNYYHWPGSWIGSLPGFMTGTGMPMRFATTNGTVINAYQAATQMTDESDQPYPQTMDALLDGALGPEGYYGAFVANMHTDSNPWPDSDAIVGAALARNVPVVTAEQMLTWVDARNRCWPSNIVWDGGTLGFTLEADANALGLQVMVPVPAGHIATQVTSNSSAIAHTPTGIKGILYVQFSAGAGAYEVEFEPDLTMPTVTAIAPTNGELGVLLGANVRVTFSEALDPATIHGGTMTLEDSSLTPIPWTVEYNAATLEALGTPGTPLAVGATYTVKVKGGAAGVKDLAGNALETDFMSGFVTVPHTIASIWSPSALPSLLTDPDPLAASVGIEVGTKFLSALPGYITAIRYYRGPSNPGPHVGSLWTVTGARLASVTFTNETATGWQQQTLTNPVSISADTPYVVSYHAPTGGYSATAGYFASSGATNEPLRAPSDVEAGGNGVYRHGPSSFPDLTYNSECYWVDVVFQTSVASNTPPTAGSLAVAVAEDTGTNLFLPGGDAESPIAYSILAGPTNGVLSGFDANSGAVTYLGATNYNGPDFFSYRVSDGSLLATGSVNLTITAVNDVPLAQSFEVATPEDVATNLFLLGSDVEGPVTYSVLAGPTNGALSGFDTNSGAITYLGTTNYNGPDFFSYRVSDGSLLATGSVNLTITAVNDVPLAQSFEVATPEDVATNFFLLGSDVEGPVTYSVLAAPTNGVLSGFDTNSGAITYMGATNYNGPDFFSYRVSDGSLLTTGSVNLTITAVNDRPSFIATPADLLTMPLRLVTVTNAATDVDNAPAELAYQLDGAPDGALIGAGGVIGWTPTLAQADSTNLLTTIVSDGLLTATNSFSVVVLPLLVGPEILGITVEGDTATLTWTAIPGYLYSLECASNNVAGAWETVMPPVVATNALMNADVEFVEDGSRLYRVRASE